MIQKNLVYRGHYRESSAIGYITPGKVYRATRLGGNDPYAWEIKNDLDQPVQILKTWINQKISDGTPMFYLFRVNTERRIKDLVKNQIVFHAYEAGTGAPIRKWTIKQSMHYKLPHKYYDTKKEAQQVFRYHLMKYTL